MFLQQDTKLTAAQIAVLGKQLSDASAITSMVALHLPIHLYDEYKRGFADHWTPINTPIVFVGRTRPIRAFNQNTPVPNHQMWFLFRQHLSTATFCNSHQLKKEGNLEPHHSSYDTIHIIAPMTA